MAKTAKCNFNVLSIKTDYWAFIPVFSAGYDGFECNFEKQRKHFKTGEKYIKNACITGKTVKHSFETTSKTLNIFSADAIPNKYKLVRKALKNNKKKIISKTKANNLNQITCLAKGRKLYVIDAPVKKVVTKMLSLKAA